MFSNKIKPDERTRSNSLPNTATLTADLGQKKMRSTSLSPASKSDIPKIQKYLDLRDFGVVHPSTDSITLSSFFKNKSGEPPNKINTRALIP